MWIFLEVMNLMSFLFVQYLNFFDLREEIIVDIFETLLRSSINLWSSIKVDVFVECYLFNTFWNIDWSNLSIVNIWVIFTEWYGFTFEITLSVDSHTCGEFFGTLTQNLDFSNTSTFISWILVDIPFNSDIQISGWMGHFNFIRFNQILELWVSAGKLGSIMLEIMDMFEN